MALAISKKLLNAQITAQAGTSLNVTDAGKLIVHIFGSSTAFTLNFEGSLDNEHFYPLGGLDQADWKTVASSVTFALTGHAFEFDVSALAAFTVNLSAVSGGDITVMANSPR